MDTIRYKIGLLVACFFIGFVVYMNSGNSKEDINPKELALSNISKVDIIRISDNRRLSIIDSNKFSPLIFEFLKSNETKINNPKSNKGLYYIRICFKNNTSELIGMQLGSQDGKYLFYKSSHYRNDKLFNKLDSISFTQSLSKARRGL